MKYGREAGYSTYAQVWSYAKHIPLLHKACYFKRYTGMLVFGRTGSMCLKKEVRKACTFVLDPSHEFFCGTDA